MFGKLSARWNPFGKSYGHDFTVSVVVAFIWGITVFCATFVQLFYSENDFLTSRFDFGKTGIPLIFMSIVFSLDFLIAYNFSPQKKEREDIRTFLTTMIVTCSISILFVIAFGFLQKIQNQYTLLFSLGLFIIVKSALLFDSRTKPQRVISLKVFTN